MSTPTRTRPPVPPTRTRSESLDDQLAPSGAITAGALLTIAAVQCTRLGLLPIGWAALPVVVVLLGAVTWVFTMARHGTAAAVIARLPGFAVAVWWAPWTAVAGWHASTAGTLGVAWVVCVALACWLEPHRPARPVQLVMSPPVGVALPTEPATRPEILSWEASLVRATRWKQVTVLDVVDWPVPEDGVDVIVAIPDGGTIDDLISQTAAIQTQRKLPNGCTVRVLVGDHQGVAILRVMLRDTLRGRPAVLPPLPEQASMNDEVPLALADDGEVLAANLRIDSMVVGGSVSSGKTTFLRRLILRLARMVDVLIWVIDPNGGGLAWPYVEEWACGRASKPLVDWVAADPAEAAIMTTVMNAIMGDRKSSAIALAAKRAAGTLLLPVSRDLAGIILVVDEGGDLAQSASLFAQIAIAGASRLVQTSRAEGGRVIQCVLRGVAGLLDKDLRVNAPVRVALPMAEAEEYDYVLAATPPKGAPLAGPGQAYIRTGMGKPVRRAAFPDQDPADIVRDSRRYAHLRPDLDERAQRVASLITPAHIVGAKNLDDYGDHPAMLSVAAGRAYSGRWDRNARHLASLRGEDWTEAEDSTRRAELDATDVPPAAPLLAPGSALASMMGAEGEALMASVQSPQGQGTVARQNILAAVRDYDPDGLRSAQVGTVLEQRGQGIHPTYRKTLLAQLLAGEELTRDDAGSYHIPERAI